MTSSRVADLTKDIAELEQLRHQSQRSNVQMLLDQHLQKCHKDLDEMNKREKQQNSKVGANDLSKTQGGGFVRPFKKLTSYAFDESDKFVKLYYSIPGISDSPASGIKAEFNENYFAVKCEDVSGIDYEINVQGLLHAVQTAGSQVKQKSGDQLLVMLKKTKEGEHWGSLLKLDKKETKKVPKMEEDEDPQAGLMKMMQQMYEDGDDEMKRTIRKAWHEAQSKKTGPPDMDF